MLIYSEKRLVPTDINMLVIKGDDDRYYYIHRMLYDQAVIINDIYKDNLAMLIKQVVGEETSRDDVETFIQTAPSPINILGPFLLLIKGELTEYQDMVGAIHAMSGPINFRKLLQTPVEYRTNPEFSLSIREEYELAWDRFFLNTLEFNPSTTFVKIPTNVPVMGTATAMTGVDVAAQVMNEPIATPEPAPAPTVSASYQEEPVVESEPVYDDPAAPVTLTADTPIGEAGPDDDWSLDKITPDPDYCWANINYHEGMTLVEYIEGLAMDVDPFEALCQDPYMDDAYKGQFSAAYMHLEMQEPERFNKLMQGRAVEETFVSSSSSSSSSSGSSSSSSSSLNTTYSAEELDAMTPEEKAKLKEGLSGLDLLRSGLIV